MQKTRISSPTSTPASSAAPVGARVLLALFVFCLLIPSSWEIAGLRLTTARIYALCMIIPLCLRLLALQSGRIQPVDVLLMLHAFWIMISMLANHGFSEVPISGMLVVELYSGFLVGRVLIRDAAAFKRLFQLLLLVMAVLLPFALYEMINERAIVQEWFRSLFGSAHPKVYHAPRMGFYRAQTVMQHPILWGVFCSIAVANVVAIWSIRRPGGLLRFGIAIVATFSSVSSGAVLGALIQVGLMVWGWITKGAWKTLLLGFAAAWVFLSLASNRGPIGLMVSYLTFNTNNAWGRISNWRHGNDEAMATPKYGIGNSDCTRPD